MAQLTNKPPIITYVLHHEHELHEHFGHLRERREYFRDCEELRKYLDERCDRITHEEALQVSPFLARASENRDV